MIALQLMHHATCGCCAPPMRMMTARLVGLIVALAYGPARVLVTGATGFIGRHLVHRLRPLVAPHAITCLVHESPAPAHEAQVARYRDAGIRILTGDLARATVSAQSPPDIDVVFHLAANIDTAASAAACRVNDEGTANLIAWLGNRLEGGRVVYASSVAVCDTAGARGRPLDESSPTAARTAYGRTKLRGEEILKHEADRLKFTYTILRLPTVYGPGQKRDGMFDRLLRYARNGSLLARVDWPGRTSILYVGDAARVMTDLATMREARNQTFCVASDEALTVGEIARRIGALSGHPIAPIDLPDAAWRVVRWLAWNRQVAAIVPPFACVAHWRLGLIADDGFWQSAAKLRRVYPRRLLTLEEGLRLTLDDRGAQAREAI